MTYEPGRDPASPLDVHPRRRTYDAARAGAAGWPMILGLLALAILGALFFFNMGDRSTVATDNRPTASPATTGSGINNPAPRETPGAPMQRPTTPAPAPK
jgi:hypothetical protein